MFSRKTIIQVPSICEITSFNQGEFLFLCKRIRVYSVKDKKFDKLFGDKIIIF